MTIKDIIEIIKKSPLFNISTSQEKIEDITIKNTLSDPTSASTENLCRKCVTFMQKLDNICHKV